MQWFRKSLYAIPVNPHKSNISQHCNRNPNNCTIDITRGRYNSCPNDDHHQLPDYTIFRSVQNKTVSCSLTTQCIEIVDSEEFFADPLELKTSNDMVEKKGFINLSTTRKGLTVKYPTFGERFFLANFEKDLTEQYTAIQIDTEIVTYLVDQNRSNSHKTLKKKKKCSYKRSFTEFLFDNRIQMGLVTPKLDTNNPDGKLLAKGKRHLNFPIPKKNVISYPPLSADVCYQETEITDHITANSSYRSQLDTITLACSIIQTSDKCWQANNLIKLKPNINLCVPVYNDIVADHIFNIQEKFRLDDNGNILLNTNHIKEVRASSFATSNQSRQADKLYRRYLKHSKIAEETVFYKNTFYTKPFKHLLNTLCNTLTCHPRNKVGIYHGGSGESIRLYTMQLAKDQCTTFARNIENFIFCTKESRESAPQVVMRNMRQFMNGMKNYLVKHGEGNFQQEVDAARARLNSDEFLNLDAILETVMHQLVVLPLREHLYGMFVDYYTRSEDIQLLAQNVKYACGRNAIDFGIRSTVTPPSANSLQSISNLLLRLQEAELPLEKLDLFLCIITSIFEATGCPRGQQLGADDFLPILVFVVAKCGFVGAEIEAEFMWGLLQPTLLNGEPGYYLTALCSAVHVLKSFMASENENGNASIDWRSSSLPACSSVLRVIIPDECNGSLQTRTLPVRPHTTTREVCRIIAHKARITNPQDYGLFKLLDGEETILNDNECPQDIRLAAKGKHCMLAYKRIDAKIAWPTATQPILN